MKKCIVTIIGTRPQFIKASAISRAFKLGGVEEVLINTGQHYDALMADIFFEGTQFYNILLVWEYKYPRSKKIKIKLAKELIKYLFS